MELKYLDGLMGFVIGDAMGVPLEFKSRNELLSSPVTKMIGNGTYHLPAGVWSDDTSMLIATIDSINNKNGINYDDITLNFIAFKNHAHYTALNEVFDIGSTFSKAILKYDEERVNPCLCGLDDIKSNDNGSLMRILPIAYYALEKKLNDEEVYELVCNLSSITHRHEISIMGCLVLVRYAMFLLAGKDKYSAYNMVKIVDYSMFSDETKKYYNRLLRSDIGQLTIDDIKSTCSVVDTLEASIWVLLKSENFKEAIIGAINLGESTASIAALTGAIAGITYGYDTIPSEWIEGIARRDYVMDIFEEFSENKYE